MICMVNLIFFFRKYNKQIQVVGNNHFLINVPKLLILTFLNFHNLKNQKVPEYVYVPMCILYFIAFIKTEMPR